MNWGENRKRKKGERERGKKHSSVLERDPLEKNFYSKSKRIDEFNGRKPWNQEKTGKRRTGRWV